MGHPSKLLLSGMAHPGINPSHIKSKALSEYWGLFLKPPLQFFLPNPVTVVNNPVLIIQMDVCKL